MRRKAIAYMLSAVMLVSMFAGMGVSGASAQAGEAKLKIMSFNVLTSLNQPIEREYNGQSRGQMLTALIDGKQPDSMGLNEVTQDWLNYLNDYVSAYNYQNGATYAVTGTKAEDGTTALTSGYSEYSPILYRSDLYDIEKFGGYWFSETPDIKTSKYTDILDAQGKLLYKGMSNSRVMSYAVFKTKGTNEIAYIQVNSHYDHQSSDYVQRLCSIQVKSTADELAAIYNAPVVLTGDINSTEQSGAYQYLADGSNGYLNAKYVSNTYSTLPSSAGFGENYHGETKDVIDHIFISAGNIGVYKHDIISNPYLSDHSAVYAELSLHHMPKLDGIEVNQNAVSDFSGDRFAYNLYLSEGQLSLTLKHNAEYTVSASHNNAPYPVSAESGGQSSLSFDMAEATASILLYVTDAAGRTTIYTLNLVRESGEAHPIISEIYPNASPGFKYFEVTNAGTKSLSTDDYAFLWGNIGGDASVNWEGRLELPENRIIRPGASVVFWFTYNTDGVFAHEPTVADFNTHYYTSLTEDNLLIVGTSQAFKGYSVSASDPNQTASFTMGANKDRGMRIAYAKDSDGQAYGWTKKSTNSAFNGPSVSVSSYKSISAKDLTTSQLFKFKYVEGQTTAGASDVLELSYASPGVYDKRVGNEPKDAYTRIEAGEYDTYSLVHAEGDNLGGSLAGSWAFYSNVQFGDDGADSAVFSAAVKESNASGSVDIYIDGSSDGSLTGARKIGSLTTTPTAADWSVFKTFTCSFSERITGTHHVTLVFRPNAGKTYVGNLDYFVFHPYVAKADLAELTAISFKLDGEPLTADTALNATRKKNTYTLSAEADYLPSDADFSIKWSSSRPDIAAVHETTGQINVLKYGDFTVQASVYSNYKLFDSYATPVLSTQYKVSAFSSIEGEWASLFTPGAGKTPNAKKAAAAATGLSSNLTNGFNYIGDVVDGSSLTLSSVDFGMSGIQSFVMNMALKSSNCGGTVTLYADTVDEAHRIGTLTAAVAPDAPDNYNTYLPYTGTVEQSVTGVHDLILSFSTERTYVGNIDYLVFEQLGTAPSEGGDTVKPVIALLGQNPVTVDVGADYSDAGAQASDDRDGDITDRIITAFSWNGLPADEIRTVTEATYKVHYNVQDTAGNTAAEVTRTVIIAASANPPGNPNPETPAPIAPVAVPGLPAGVQQLVQADLKPEGAGSFTVQWSPEKETLLLPADAAGTVAASGTLKLVKEALVLELSGQTLRKLLAAAGEGAQAAQIRITAAAADSGLITQATQRANVPGAVEWTAAGGVYSLEAGAADSSGNLLVSTSASALENETVTLTLKAGADSIADPELLGVYAIGTGGAPVYAGGRWSGGEIAAEVPLNGQYAVLAYSRSFLDVGDHHWARTVIARMAAKHVIEGVGDTRFEPQKALTRAEFAAMLVRLLGLDPASGSGNTAGFADVPHEAWYASAVETAAQAGLVKGRSGSGYEPEGTVTRQEMAVMLVRAYELKAGQSLASPAQNGFADADQIGAWAGGAVAAASAAGLLQGRGDGQFAPQEQLTRAESVQVLYNLLHSLK